MGKEGGGVKRATVMQQSHGQGRREGGDGKKGNRKLRERLLEEVASGRTRKR